MPAQYLLVACALFVVHGVSIAFELPVPAPVHIPVERPTVSVPVASDSDGVSNAGDLVVLQRRLMAAQ